jgi:hypothetical protein
MLGIQYVSDDKGHRVGVLLNLKIKAYREIWEDIEDRLISHARRNDKRIPFSKVKAHLIKRGKLPRD